MTICPQCGYERKKSDEIINATGCPKCGIIYSKWKDSSVIPGKHTPHDPSKQRSLKSIVNKMSSSERLVLYAVSMVVLVVLMHVLIIPNLIKYFQSEKNNSEVVENTDSLTENQNKVSDKNQVSNSAAKNISGDAGGLPSSSGRSTGSDVDSPKVRDVYCYANSNGQLSFVSWRTGLLVASPEGTLDRAKFEKWAFDQVGGNPEAINPEREARDDLERNREQLFKSVFPSRSMNDTNLTSGEKDWLEARYNKHYTDVYNKSMKRREDAIRKYNTMLSDFDRFTAGRK